MKSIVAGAGELGVVAAVDRVEIHRGQLNTSDAPAATFTSASELKSTCEQEPALRVGIAVARDVQVGVEHAGVVADVDRRRRSTRRLMPPLAFMLSTPSMTNSASAELAQMAPLLSVIVESKALVRRRVVVDDVERQLRLRIRRPSCRRRSRRCRH